MGCWEMIFWLLIFGGVFELASMAIRAWVVRGVISQCKSLEEVDRAVHQVVKSHDE